MRRFNGFSGNDKDPVMTDTGGASRITGLSEAHLRTLRANGGGPPFYKYGRAVRYSIAECEVWKTAQRVSV